ncbi:MAG: hypothetical protein RLP44_10975 [Aggregatilineales bacterium]
MFRILDILFFTLERLRQHRMLVFWVLVGLSAATTLALSMVQYVDAVNTDVLTSKLSDPPYAFRLRYLGSWEGNITSGDIETASIVASRIFTDEIGLPVDRYVRFVRTLPWSMTLLDEENGSVALSPLDIGMLEGSEELIRITAGDWDFSATTPTRADDDPIPVLISETMLFQMGLQVGDQLQARQSGRDNVTLEIAALWQPINSNDPRWIFTPRFFNEVVIVAQSDFTALTLDAPNPPISEGAWYLIFDGSELRTSEVDALLDNISAGERAITSALPGVRMESPIDGLRAFTVEVNRLTQQLVIVILPVGGLILYFVSLVAGLLVSRQLNEDVVLRSRGMSRLQLLSVHVLMWLLLAGSALLIGIFLSPFIVRVVGRTASFLSFDSNLPALEVTLTQQALTIGGGTALIAISSGLWLAWRSTGQTITSYRRDTARGAQAWWQRMYLDVLLLIPGAYVFYTLRQQGGLETAATDPFSDPLTFVGPTLFALGLTLLFLRLLPFFLRMGAGILRYTGSVAVLMALRELTRSTWRYRGTLLMMCFTLSLTGLTASMASTIDRSLSDSVDYSVGADAVLVTAVDAQTEQDEATQGEQTTFTVTGFNVLPTDDLLGVDGVENVSRVGRYPARLQIRNQRLDGNVLGIDRASIASVARSRYDYSTIPYADLFNLLAGSRNGIILSESIALQYDLIPGQEVDMQISVLGEWYDTRVPLLGFIEYFPTMDPRDGFFALANIDPIFELVGTPLPYNVWMSLNGDATLTDIQQGVRDLEFPVVEWRDPTTILKEAQAQASRRGVLGFLSVGFVASIFLTMVGSIIQNTVSFRAQATQIGSLRAMGMSSWSSSLYLLLLQGIAAMSGVLGGTAIGVLTTLLFLPLLDFSGGLPPYLVRVAWDEITIVYVIFAGVLLFVTFITTIVASFQQLSTVVKLGEA